MARRFPWKEICVSLSVALVLAVASTLGWSAKNYVDTGDTDSRRPHEDFITVAGLDESLARQRIKTLKQQIRLLEYDRKKKTITERQLYILEGYYSELEELLEMVN